MIRQNLTDKSYGERKSCPSLGNRVLLSSRMRWKTSWVTLAVSMFWSRQWVLKQRRMSLRS